MKLLRRFLPPLLPPLYRLWISTLRYEEIGRQALDELAARGETAVICFWHGEIFSFFRIKRQLNLLPMISRSKDGDLLAHVVEKCGIQTTRGSSARGGAAALRATARAVQEKRQHPCIALDGPRGPLHHIRDGAFFLARYSESWILPVRAFCACGKEIKSWDRFKFPLPFSRVRVVYAPPYHLESDELNEENLARERVVLQRKLDELEAYAYLS